MTDTGLRSRLVLGARRRTVDALIRRGGWPLRPATLERLRDLAGYGLGAGSASLPLEASGEAAFLGRLARVWAGRDDLVVLDVGAHHGGYTRAARAAFGPGARIESFEPEALSYETLLERVGDDPAVRCHRLALGAAPGVARTYVSERDSSLTSLVPETFTVSGIPGVEGEEVEVDTLDRAAERLGVGRVDLLKVDVEGSEVAVFEGGRSLLERVAVVQFEFGERNLASRSFLRDVVTLLGPEFELFRLGPRGLFPLTYRPSTESFLHEANYVAARAPVAAALRRGSPPAR